MNICELNETAKGKEPVMNYESMKKGLSEIWKQLLNVHEVKDGDNYFLLGGNSIAAMKLIAAVEKEFLVSLTLEDLFEISTFSGQADLIFKNMQQSSVDMKKFLIPNPSEWSEEFPLTDIQEAYWMGRQDMYAVGRVSTKYYMEFEKRDLDVKRANEAWQKMISHHSMMRTVFSHDGRHQQSLKHVHEYRFPTADLSEKNQDEIQEYIEHVRQSMMEQNFDTTKWPLFEVRISKMPDQIFRIHVCFDNIVFDAFSILFVLNQWEKLYEDPAYRLPVLETDFRDYVLALKKIEQSEAYGRDEQYWAVRLDQMEPAPELPLARKPETLTEQHFIHMEERLDEENWNQLKSAVKNHGLTVSAVLLTAYAEVLAKWSRHSRFTINLTRYNKLDLHPQMDEIIGDFTALTLFSFDGADGDSFLKRCQKTLEQLWQDMDHPYMCGVRVLRELNKKDADRFQHGMPVVFTSSLGLDAGGSEERKWIGKRVYSISQTSQVWLDHQILEDDGELVLVWDAVEELFPEDMLEDMFHSYLDLVKSLSQSEAMWTEESASLARDPKQETKIRMNETQGEESMETLLSLFEKQCLKTPDREAAAAADRHLTYKELHCAAVNISRRISGTKDRKGKTIAVVMEKGWEQAAAVLGIFKAGCAYLPVDPSIPANRLRLILKESGTETVITQPKFSQSGLWPDDVGTIAVDSSYIEKDSGGEPSVSSAVSPGDLAYIIYTSGSTGRPKGVMIKHCAAVNTILDINQKFKIGPMDRVLSLSSLSFDLSVYDLFGMLSAGGCTVFPDPAKAQDTDHWIRLIREEQITVWNTVPASMRLLMNSLRDSQAGLAGETLRLVLMSGDWIPLQLPDEIRAVFPDLCIVSLGGATEASIWSNYFVIGDIAEEWKSIPYGTPLTNQKLYILNDLMEDTPDWVPGDLYIAGRGLAEGYCSDDEKTGQKFIRHPRTGERIYATGDIAGYLPGGCIEFLGREDSQVKINGYRIELGEIEAAAENLDGVKEAVVEPYNAELNTKLACFVVPGVRTVSEPFHEAEENGFIKELETLTEEYPGIPEQLLCRVQEQHEWMDLMTTEAIYQMFSDAGLFCEIGKSYTAAYIKEMVGSADQYSGLVAQWIRMLTNDGVLEEDEVGKYRCIQSVESVAGRLRRRKDSCQCGDEKLSSIMDQVPVSDLITGRTDPLKMFLDDSGSLTPQALETFSDAGDFCVDAAVKVMETFLMQFSDGKPAKILEIGTRITPFYLKCQKLFSSRVNYRYTDESLFFLEKAQGKNHGKAKVEYGVLNFDSTPFEQGYEAGSFDLIVANNTLHRFKDLNRTLSYAKQLLSPGGVLLFMEGTQNSRAIINTTGLLAEGFCYLEDERSTLGLPMLTSGQWNRMLEGNGFPNVWHYLDGMEAEQMKYNVFVAGIDGGAGGFSQDQFLEGLKERLPSYMIPAKIVVIDHLPLSSNGKVDRKTLRDLVKDQKRSEKAAPKNETERCILETWKTILKKNDIGVTDNFFELGGDSLLAIQCIDNLNKQFGYHILMKQFYDALTVQKLAGDLTASDEGEI